MMLIGYRDGSPTLYDLRRVLKAMRWADLEEFAQTLDGYRCHSTRRPSKRPLTAELLNDWVCNTEPTEKEAKP